MLTLQATGDIRKVSFWLGHASLQSTEVYLRADPTEKLEAQIGVTFMTLRRRSPALLREVANVPRSAWRTVRLEVPHRIYQTPPSHRSAHRAERL